MKGKHTQFKGRSVISLLVAVLILAMAVSPVLAEEDEGGGSGTGRSQAVVSDEAMGYLSLHVARQLYAGYEPQALVWAR